MTGLFDTLAARFAPGAQPAIRPRPHARFENLAAGEPLREETVETMAQARPAALATTRAPASSTAHPSPAIHQAPAAPVSEERTPSVELRRIGEETELSMPASGNVEAVAADPVTPIPRQRASEPEKATLHLRKPPQVQSTESQSNPPKESPPGDPPIAERIIETRLQAAPPQSTSRQAEPAVPQPTPGELPPLAAAARSPVVKIGRIEVSRPNPPVPQPPKQPPMRIESPRRAAPSSHATAKSSLTDYLGWKR